MHRLTACLAFVGALIVAPAAASAAVPPQPNLLANSDFESAAHGRPLARWTCDAGTTAAWGGHSGQYSLTGTPTLTATAECAQSVPVRPSATYTLSGWVRGGYAFLGTELGGTWAPPSGQWTRLSVTFTTGPTTTDVRVHVHGWYAQAAFAADDLVLSGPDSRTTVPVPPIDLAPSETTSHSVRLTWTGSPGASRYRIHQDGVLRATTAGSEPSVVLTGLAPGSSHVFAVSAVSTAGESALSEPVTANLMPAQDTPPYAPRSLVATTPAPGQVWLAWEAVQTAGDGYHVYCDGTRIAWSYGPAYLAVNLPAGEHTFEVTALNSAGESPRSNPVTVMAP
ncbi:fibronectin type III domain-containing protein [Dactylosporangium cerinum]|uniref:Fibronectin type III domain-containing protein n=1 Tax=Dactylosporangium cerinum TaxID=1434730 RepID=A0ABV9W178_9ACTN